MKHIFYFEQELLIAREEEVLHKVALVEQFLYLFLHMPFLGQLARGIGLVLLHDPFVQQHVDPDHDEDPSQRHYAEVEQEYLHFVLLGVVAVRVDVEQVGHQDHDVGDQLQLHYIINGFA